MGVSLHVVGFIPPDDRWHKMKAAYQACKEAGIRVPDEVAEFFGDCDPEESPGREVAIENSDCVREYANADAFGYDIFVSQLPRNVRIVRTYVSC